MTTDEVQRLISKVSNAHVYTSPITYGVCATVSPYGLEATLIMNLLEPFVESCNMCDEPAVRIGVFETQDKHDKKAAEFRGLCERHKQTGQWSNADTAWGWD